MSTKGERSYYPLILNSTNLINDGYGNKYRYNFPTTASFKGAKVALANVSLYYSWFNITAAYANNKFDIIWPTSTGTTTYNLTIPDGFYDIPTLNTWLQSWFVENGLYLVDASGNFVYYVQFQENATYYSVQMNIFPVPDALPSGYTNPASMTFPASPTTPQVVILDNAFATLTGFPPDTYPNAPQSTTQSYLSPNVPQLSPVESIIMTCDILANKFSLPNSILYSFTQSNVPFGGVIASTPYEFSFIDVQDGAYSGITITFLNQNFDAFVIRDTNLVITLLISV